MKKYFTLVFLNLLVSLSCQAQVDSLPELRVGLKVTPTQFIFGEKAATIEVKFRRPYSVELKAGVFGQDKYEGFEQHFGRNGELTAASGYLTQVGVKRYLKRTQGDKLLFWDYRAAYLQVLGLYKQSSFEKRTLYVSSSSLAPYTEEAQSIHTFGLKGQIGSEVQLSKVLTLEVYVGLGGRIRAITRTIYREYPEAQANYPVEAKKLQIYPTPQAGINIGIQFPVKGKT